MVTKANPKLEICLVKKQTKPRKLKKRSRKLTKEQAIKMLAKRIRSLREQKGYSSYEYFAYDHNISRAQYGRYERGEDLRFSSLIKVAQAFGMSLEEFLKGF